MQATMHRTTRARAGFSLVELRIVVVILGVLSMMAVPRDPAAVEQGKASEAFAYLDQIAEAQEMHNARHGEYAKRIGRPDIQGPEPSSPAGAAP